MSSPEPPPCITRIEPLRPRGLRVRIHLTRGDPVEVALEALERAGLGAGDPFPASDRHHLLNADADIRVRDAALNLLSYRARTRRELRTRLVAKGFRPARVDVILDRLQERGLVDDATVAAAFVRDRLRHRPRGPARLRDELRAKGIPPPLAEEVVHRVLEDEEVGETDLALEVARAWVARQGRETLQALACEHPSPERERARRRLYGYLARRGFRGPPLTRAMDAAREAARRAGRTG
ncbi:MAG: regulatory protein RecX [Gemmatimonadota bacterium]